MCLSLINGDKDYATGGAEAREQQAEGAGAIVANDQPDGKFYPTLTHWISELIDFITQNKHR